MTANDDLAPQARALFSAQTTGVLAALTPQDGYPYTSLVEYAPLPDGDALFFFSTLAQHRRCLEADARASLFVAPAAPSLEKARLCLQGTCTPIDTGDTDSRRAWAEIYLASQPQAKRYIDFGDFAFFRLQIQRLRYVAGFGQMDWIDAQTFRSAHL
jgi:heme iron utilization protein